MCIKEQNIYWRDLYRPIKNIIIESQTKNFVSAPNRAKEKLTDQQGMINKNRKKITKLPHFIEFFLPNYWAEFADIKSDFTVPSLSGNRNLQ